MKKNKLKKILNIGIFFLIFGFLYFPSSLFNNVEFANAATRVKTVEFFGGQDAGSATLDNSATAQNFTQQNVEIAESSVDIIDAYVEFSAQIAANAATTSTESMIYFDACNPTACTPTPAIMMNTAGLGTNSGEAQTIRLRADVSAEATLAAFTGGTFAFRIGYCIDGATGTDAGTCNGTAAASIQGANAKLVISYTYDDTSATQTNTVIYPLESSTGVGSKTAVQASCTMDSNCPKFSYNANIPEISSQVSQFFHTQVSAGAGAATTSTDYAFIPQVDGNASGSTIYFEQALVSNGGWMNHLVSGLTGYANNSAQQLETGVNGNSRVLGGENYVTYKYANNAATKTKTIVMPVGEVQTVGSKTKSSLVGSTVYFPETGVNVEKAWFRVHTTAGGNTTAVNLDLTTKVGGNAESGITSYSFNSATQGVTDDGYFIHMIPSTDYTELEAATADTGKLVQMTADWATARGAVSGELVITYTYTSDADGFNQTQTLFGGQSTAAAATTFSAASGEVDPYIYTSTGTKTILGVSVLMNGKDTGALANQTTGINMTVSGNACTASNTSTTLTDTEITRIAMFKSITGIVTNNNATTYTPCYSSSEASIFNGRVAITVMVDLRTTDISGTTSLGDASSVIKVAINGVLDSATGSIVSGAWTITPATVPTTGQSIIVFINTDGAGDSGEATSITKYDGTGDITGMELNSGVLTIGSVDNQSITLANIDDYTCTADEDVMHSVISSVLNIEGQSCAGAVNNSFSGETIKILSGNTLTIGSTETLTTEKINNAGTLTSTANATYNLSGTSGTLFTNTGTFTQATSTVNLTGNGDATINSGSPTFYNLTSSGTGTKSLGAAITVASNGTLTLSAGTFNPAGFLVTGSGTNTLAVSSGATLDVDASTFAGNYSAGFGTITLNSASTTTYSLGGTQTVSGTPTYGNLTISGSGTKSLAAATTAAGTLTVTAGTLDTVSGSNYGLTASKIVINGGTLLAQASTINLTGTSGTLFTYSSGTFTAGTSTTVFSPDATITLTSGNISFYNVSLTPTLSASGKTYTFGSGTLAITGDFMINPTAVLTLTLTVNPGANITVTGLTTITGTNNGTSVLDLDPGTDYNLSTGTLNIGLAGTLDGTSFAGTVTLTGTTGTLFTNNGTFTPGSSTVILSGNGSATVNSGAINFYNLTSSGTGTKTLGSEITVANTLNISAGTFAQDVNSITLTGTGTPLSVNGTLDGGTANFYYTGNGSVTIPAAGYYQLLLSPEITSNQTYTLNANTITNGFIISPLASSSLTLTVNMGADLTTNNITIIGTGGAIAKLVTRPASTDYNITTTNIGLPIDGYLDMSNSSSVITLTGTGSVFNMDASGTINPGTSTIIITDNSASAKEFIGGGKTYYNLTFAPSTGTGTLYVDGSNTFNTFSDTGTGAHTIVFTANSTQTVTAFTIESATSSVITMQSSNTGVDKWYIVDTAGANQVRYVSIADSDASGGADWDAYTYSADNTNGGNNTVGVPSWVFAVAVAISGTTDLADASNVIKVAVNGALDSASGSISSGTWSITLASGVTTGQVVVVYVDGNIDRYESTNVSKYDGAGNMTGMILNAKVLTIGSVDNQSISLTDLDTYDCSADEDIMYSVTSSVLNTEGQGCAGSVNNSYTGDNLSVLASNTLTIATAETVTTEAINNTGTITASGSPTINLDGTAGTLFTNSGTFTAGSSTVNMRGNGDATINSASTVFYNLTSSGTGTKTMGEEVRILPNGTLTVSTGTFSPSTYLVSAWAGPGSGVTLAVSSGATINVEASSFSTNYDGSIQTFTLNSNSTTNYNLAGTQTVSGTPTYGNLTISGSGTKSLGANTTAAGTVTLTSGTLDTSAASNYSLTAPRLVFGGGTLTANASTIDLNGASGTLFDYSSGTFNAGTSLVKSSGTGNVTLNSGSPTFSSLQIVGTGVKTLGAGITMDTNNLILSLGTFDPLAYVVTFTNGADININGGATIRVGATTFSGNYSGYGSIVTAGTSTLEYSRSGDQTVTSPATLFDTDTVLTSGSGVKTLGADLSTPTFTIGSGTTLALSTYTLTLSRFGNPFDVTGTFTANTGTVKFTGQSDVIIPAVSYYNLNLEPTISFTQEYTLYATTITNNFTINPTAASTSLLSVSMAASLTVTGATTITGTTSGISTLDLRPLSTDYNLTTGTLSIGSAGTLDAGSSSSVITLNGATGTLFTNSGTFTPGSSTIIANSNAAVTLFSTGFNINSLTLSPTITANRTYTMGGVMTLNGTLSVIPTASSSYVLTLDTTGTALTAYSSDTTIDGQNSANVSWSAYSNTHTKSLSVGTGDTVAFGGSYVGIYTTSGTGVTNNGTISGGTFHFLGDGDITLTSGTMTLGGIVLDPTITTGRTYTFGSGVVSVAGDFTINPTAGSTLLLTVNPAANISVTGTTTITKTSSATSILDLRPASTDYNLTTGYLNIATGGTLDADSSSSIIILSGTSGTLITNTGTFTTGYSTVNMTGNGDAAVSSGAITFNNLTSSGTGTKTLGGATTVGGDLTISTGTLQLSTLGLEVHGTTSITGTLNDNSATGTNLFTNNVTINSGGVWSTTNNPSFTFREAFINNSSSGFTSGTGDYIFAQFSGSGQELSGSQPFTITNVIGDAGYGLIVSGQYPTIGTLTNNASKLIKFTGTLPTITTLDASASNNTVQYAGATQTVKDATYHNLIIGDSSVGTKTLAGNITVNGDLTVNTDSVLDPTSSYSVATSGTNTLNVTGTIKVQHSTFAGSYTGFDTVNLNGDSTVDYALAGTQTIDNTPTYYNMTISGSGVKTLAGATTMATSGILAVDAGTFDPSTYLFTGSGTNSITVASGATLRVGASTFAGNYSAGFTAITPASGSTVDYNAAGAQTIDHRVNYKNLTASNGGVKTLGGNSTVNGTVTVATGVTLDPTASYILTGAGTDVLDVTGTIRVQASTFGGNYASLETKTFNTGSIVDYYLSGTQTVDHTLSYDGLTISTGGTKTLGGTTTATGTTTVAGGTLDVGASLGITLNTGALSLTGGTFLSRSADINLTGTGTVFNYSSGTYTRDAETINLTDSSGSSKTFAGGGRLFNTVVFAGNGAGEFIISGDNTFNKFKVLNPPHTLLFTAGSTQTVKEWDVAGTPGNLVTLNSTSNGTDWNLYLAPTNYGFGTYSSEYLSIRDSAASGNSYFNAIYAGYSSVDDTTGGSTNTGWIFQIRSQGGGGGAVEASANVGNCADGQQNGDETGTDTGGRCTGGGGSGSGSGTCNDNVQNDDETGVDTGGRCALGTCADGIQNGDETGTDTGGRCTGGGGAGDAGGDVGFIYKNRSQFLAAVGYLNIPNIFKIIFSKFFI